MGSLFSLNAELDPLGSLSVFSGKGMVQLLYRLLDLESGEGETLALKTVWVSRCGANQTLTLCPGSENSLVERGLIVEENWKCE